MSSEITKVFLALMKAGIGHESGHDSWATSHGKEIVDWNALEELAARQGLSAILVDGVGKLPDDKRPPKMVLLQWIGETLQVYEYRYEQYRKAIADLSAFYNMHGFKMMVLKGYACALDWPKPEHRPLGDIDIWLFGQQKEADAALAASSKYQDLGFKIDNSHHHHSVFNWGEFMVENHYDFINIYHHKSNYELEAIFKELGKDDTHYVAVKGERIYFPSPNLHALFLLKHTMNDFTSFSMSFRQVLDWAFFVEKHTKEIDWNWLTELLEKYHMKDFFNCINAICVEDLGFPINIFPLVQFVPMLKDKVLNDILEPAYTAEEPHVFVKRLVYKYHRWKGNKWKHEMCYNESMWSAFWRGVWSHILKPKSM